MDEIPRRFIRRSLILGISAAVATLMLTGCGAASPSPGRVVVVTAPTTGQAQPRLGPADDAVLAAAAESDLGTADVVVAGDPAAATRIGLTPLRQVGDGATQVEHGPARPALIASAVAHVHDVLARLAVAGGSPDLLRAITDTARTGSPGTMIVADSGVSTISPLDLHQLGWDQDPDSVAEDLAARGFLPDLRGWTVRFNALGAVAGDQPPMPTPQVRWLEQLWTSICRHGSAVSCVVDPAPGPAAPPGSTRSVTPVAVPDATTRHGAGGSVEVTLPASRLGFTEGSAMLPADVGPVLSEIVADARGGAYSVEVDGYVAFWGSASYQQDLAHRRARAVADRLITDGVAADLVTAVGRGAGDGPDASMTAGRFDEAKVQRAGLRRVVVTLRPRAVT